MSPLISLWVGYSMPAAMSIYWVSNNVLSLLQELLAGRILKKDYEAAAAIKAEQERLEKEEEKQRRREAAVAQGAGHCRGKGQPGKGKRPSPWRRRKRATPLSLR